MVLSLKAMTSGTIGEGSEQRAFPRFVVAFKINYDFEEARAISLGVGGLGMLTTKPLAVGDLLDLGVFFPDEGLLEVKGQVRWSQRYVRDDEYSWVSGIMFVDQTPECMRRICGMVDRVRAMEEGKGGHE